MTADEKREAFCSALQQAVNPNFFLVMEHLFAHKYTGRIILDCTEGVPRVVEVPQPNMQVRLAFTPLDKFRGRSQTA
jgi:uncharacterized protein YqiB (DUF1249 family)